MPAAADLPCDCIPMGLPSLGQTLQRDAVAIVFLNVLLQQRGLPVPAVPTMLLAGSLAAAPGPVGKILAAAVVTSVLADGVWSQAGKRCGHRVLAGLCKLSINPASCVSQIEARFIRRGIPSLVLAEFIPDFSTAAPPIAGAFRMHQGGIPLAAGAGGALRAARRLLHTGCRSVRPLQAGCDAWVAAAAASPAPERVNARA